MITIELRYLDILKQELEGKYKETHPECSLKITDWRQQEIIRFQKLMQDVVKGRISEKWFYTHIKPEKNTKMPRIDTLNLLAEFLGYQDWEDFKKEKGVLKGFSESDLIKESFFKKNKVSISIIVIIMVLSGIAYSTGLFDKSQAYEFCFIDADTKGKIIGNHIEIEILHEGQSPETITCDTNACFYTETNDKKISFIVKAQYYKPDTITRYLNKENKKELIQLKQDDYSLMIHVFSTSKVKDWEKQRKKLDEMLAEDAEIYQIDSEERGVEIYNKEEFIDKMTMPVSSLKNIEIIEVAYSGGKISMMRFIQRSK